MEVLESQQVLRCELCSKPFDKEASLKRHLYYCRDKKGSSRKVRMRSCAACVKAKARCDTMRPSCARCVARHGSCSYPKEMVKQGASSNASSQQTNHLDDFENMDSATVALTIPSLDEIVEPTEATLDFPEFNFASLGFGLPDWGLPERLDSSPTNKLGPSVSMLPRLERRYRWPEQTIMADQSGGNLIPRMPTYHLRSFTQSKSLTGKGSATATLMTCMLTSYPRIMYNPGSLPPFIHPHSLRHNAHIPNEGAESLTTCVTLMQMASSGASGSRKLFWKNVRLECERLQVEMLTFDKWGLLSAMQALTIYILVRLQEGETPDNNHDVSLLSTLWMVACGLNEQVNFGLCIARSGLYHGSNHSEWVFEESRRRLALVYQILKMLYSLDPATSCAEPDGFLLAPLPGRKKLWEAPDAQAWMAEKSRDGVGASVFGVLTGGQMVRMQEQQVLLADGVNFPLGVGDGESAGNWREWCAGMDELGALVTLATSLAST